MRRIAIVLAAMAAFASRLHAQSPLIEQTAPRALAPGKPTEFAVGGEHIASPSQLWTTFPVSTAPGSRPVPESGGATFRVQVPSGLPTGIGAIQIAGNKGASPFHLVMIDPLPGLVASGSNATASTAQELTLPVAVDGVCEPWKSDFYKFKARKGQRITIEIVAQRLGSLLDPRIRLTDLKGRDFGTTDDTSGLGADCAVDWSAPAAGVYVLELRDTKYEGGPRHQYRLRIGDFARAPLNFIADAIPPELRQAGIPLPTRHAEQEPNDKASEANPIALPATITGAFAKAGDRDCYEFEARKDQRIVVRGQSRSLGSPCDLFFQIQSTNGDGIAVANLSGADDGTITNTFKTSGTYRLVVEELNRLGGPGLNYRLELQSLEPGFALNVEPAVVSAPAGGSFEISVTPLRRDFDGPIQLQLVGLGPGFVVTNDVIATKTNSATLSATVPANLSPGELRHFAVIGKGNLGKRTVEVRASTLPALRKLFPQMPYPPEALDGVMTLGITEQKP